MYIGLRKTSYLKKPNDSFNQQAEVNVSMITFFFVATLSMVDPLDAAMYSTHGWSPTSNYQANCHWLPCMEERQAEPSRTNRLVGCQVAHN